jgi:hypothetical protein
VSKQATSHARRFVAREGTTRRARDTRSSRGCAEPGFGQVRNGLSAGAEGIRTAGPSPERVVISDQTKRSHFESAIVAGNDRGGASRIGRRGANCADIVLDVLHRDRFGH